MKRVPSEDSARLYEQAWDLRRSNSALSTQLAQQLLADGEQQESPLQVAWARLVLAVHQGYGGNLDNCFDYAQSSLEIFMAHNDTKSQLRAYNVLGYVYIVLNNLAKAFEILMRGLLVARDFGDIDMQLYYLFNIGDIYKNGFQYYDKALEYLMEAHNIATQSVVIAAHPLLPGIHANIAHCLQMTHAPKSQIDYHINRALELSQANDDQQTRSLCLHLLALTHLEAGELEETSRYLQEEYQLVKISQDPYSVVYTDLIQLRLLILQGQYPEAIALATKALEIAEEKGYDSLIFHFYKSLGEAYFKLGQYELSAINYLKNSEAHEKILSRNVENRLLIMSTEFKIQQEAKQLHDQLRERHMAALTELVNGVAHEINTPLGTAITLSSYISAELDELQRTSKQHLDPTNTIPVQLLQLLQGCDVLQASLHKTAAIVEQFKKLSTNNYLQDLITIPIQQLFDELQLEVSAMPKAQPLDLRFDAPSHLTIESYDRILSYILQQLIENAITHAFATSQPSNSQPSNSQPSNSQHSKSPQIIVASRALQNDTEIEFTVSDNGDGIAREHVERIFNPFFTTNRSKGGLGLGLNIVYNLVTEVLKGKIDVISTVGEGSTFRFILPRRMPIKHLPI